MKRLVLSCTVALGLLFSSASLTAQTAMPQATVKTPEGANDPQAHAYLSKTRKWLNACKSIEFRFSAAMLENGSDKPSDSRRGSILIQGNRYRLITGADEYYCNGKELWAYSPALKEVAVYDCNESLSDMNPAVLLQNYEKHYRAKYIRQQTIDGSARNIIDLTPIEKAEVLKIRIYLNNSDNRIFKMEMYLPQNHRFDYKILSIQENVSVSESDFVFDSKKYPQVQINDMR